MQFNTAGPCVPGKHYMLPAAARVSQVRGLVDGEHYFVVRAPRQSGKTTSFLELGRELTAEGRFCAVLLSLEVGAWATDDPGKAELPILTEWRAAAEWQLPPELLPPPWPEAPPGSRIAAALGAWAQACPRPLVLFLDEVDALRDATLVSVLRQLRSAFGRRPQSFPSSIALIGLRDVRDYLVAAGSHLGSASPFNIKTEAITLEEFTADEVASLLGQHTHATGQAFTPAALDRAFALSQGQPWLVNALARQCVEVLCPDGRQVDEPTMVQAGELLIRRRDTHLDSLVARLREPRVAPIVAAALLGDDPRAIDTSTDDFRYTMDLGLLRVGPQGVTARNPIYREILVRVLSQPLQDAIPEPTFPWRRPDGGLDLPALLLAFRDWWRENAEILYEHESAPYREAAAHLALMGFLQRVVNGGGRVMREYAAARGRVDLLIEYGEERHVVEIKRVPPRHRTLERVREQGIEQLTGYLETMGLPEGHLVIFDQREGRSWEDRLWTERLEHRGRRLWLWGG